MQFSNVLQFRFIYNEKLSNFEDKSMANVDII